MLSSPGKGGVLIADDTGIGKTSQTFGVLAMMMHRAEMAGMNARKHMGLLEGLPCSTGPHIIVAPSSLIDNWRAEGMMWFNITVRFFVYEGSSEVWQQLLAPGSSFHQNEIKPYQKVILVSSSVSIITHNPEWISDNDQVLTNEMKELYGKDGDMNKPMPLRSDDSQHLLLLKYTKPGCISTFVCDEAHMLRSRRALYSACMHLARAAKANIALTATPFYTGPRVRKSVTAIVQ
jgi:SNF2 family DNA or RNA helicase